MEPYFAFTDECGNYQKDRSRKFILAHPFYVRATIIISMDDYYTLQKSVADIKQSLGLSENTEIKWSHYGNSIKGNYNNVPHRLSSAQLQKYYADTLSLLNTLNSVVIYYTLTDNNLLGRVDEIALLRMHLQNACQNVQRIMQSRDGFAIIVADDLNSKTKLLKQAVYNMALSGDYVQYSNIKKGLYIDFSDQCHGLQMADICAGVFTASLKYESAVTSEKHKFQCGHNLFFSKIYQKTKNYSHTPPIYEVYKIGVKEVPNGAGDVIAQTISHQIEEKLEHDLRKEFE